MCTFVQMGMSKPEVDIRRHLQSFSTLLFEARSLTEPGAHWFSKTS